MKPMDFDLPTRVVFGAGRLRDLGAVLDPFDGRRVFVVTDKAIARTGLVQELTDLLARAGREAVVFDEVEPEPTLALVDRAADLRAAAQADTIVALGGGSVIDVAKGVALLGRNPGRIADYVGAGRVAHDPLPLVAVPTTAGTGSEVSMAAVLADGASHLKKPIHSPRIRPRVALLDPLVLRHLPRHVAIDAGMDALTHLIEGYVSRGATPFTDTLALDGIRRIGRYLLPFVADRSHVEAAGQMQYAALLGGIVLTHARTGLAHTLTRPLGGRLPHGRANAIVLPSVMEYNLSAAPEKFRAIAVALGESVEGGTLAGARRAIEAVRQLCAVLDIPRSLSEAGVVLDDPAALAEAAYAQDLSKLNPRTFTVEDIRRLYEQVA
ncbi:MAG: iron-containing alcohol dehydrogenase [Actinomycetia bacterium]|nr:iron-containing alcohol dehydrogenase [Actinomycetes bacterium]